MKPFQNDHHHEHNFPVVLFIMLYNVVKSFQTTLYGHVVDCDVVWHKSGQGMLG